LILIHPMDDFGWSGRRSKCMMWCSRLVFVLWAVEKILSWQVLTFGPLSRQSTNKRPKPFLPNHHNWSWYIQWMILDGLEGDPSAWCDASGLFLLE
jgi:hypothetical protein